MFADAECTCQSNVNWLHACMQPVSEVLIIFMLTSKSCKKMLMTY